MNITNLRNSFVSNGIKELWHSEEKDLSPFVAEHLNEISDIIGIPFGNYVLEKRVGRYESDIVVDILDDEASTAIIENKIGSFDHDHLGKAITYMSYLNAKTIIWVCDSFNDEHIKAINYLNKITGDEYSFFGICINVYKFNDNNYSYEFNVVAKPDFIEKSINSSLSEKSINTRNTYLNYWNVLKSMLTGEPHDKLYIAARGQNYCPIKTTVKGVSLVLSIIVNRGEKCAKISIYDENNNLNSIKEFLIANNLGININSEFGKKNNKEYLYVSKTYVNDLSETLDWMKETYIKIYNSISSYK